MTSSNKDLQAAFSQHYNQFQTLTFILERRGIISRRELAEIYGELEEYDLAHGEAPFRAPSQDHRISRALEAEQTAPTSAPTGVKPQVRALSVVTQTSVQEVI